MVEEEQPQDGQSRKYASESPCSLITFSSLRCRNAGIPEMGNVQYVLYNINDLKNSPKTVVFYSHIYEQLLISAMSSF